MTIMDPTNWMVGRSPQEQQAQGRQPVRPAQRRPALAHVRRVLGAVAVGRAGAGDELDQPHRPAAAARYKNPVGHVFLNGVVEVPAAPGADPFVFYLPEGYVPTYNHYFVVNRIGVNPPTFYNITVGQTTPRRAAGACGSTPTTGQHISLAGIHFRVDPPGFIAPNDVCYPVRMNPVSEPDTSCGCASATSPTPGAPCAPSSRPHQPRARRGTLRKETGGGRNVFGCDHGPGRAFCHETVTKEKVTALMRSSLANGVGPTQLTWKPYVQRAIDRGAALTDRTSTCLPGSTSSATCSRTRPAAWGAAKRYNGGGDFADDGQRAEVCASLRGAKVI